MEQLPDLTVTTSDKTITEIERVISIIGGAYLLYDGFKKEKKSVFEIAAAGFMIYRGVKGFLDDRENKLTLAAPKKPKDTNINIHARLIVNKPVNEVYNFWRHLGNLPLFMKHLESVTVLSDTLSEWTVKVPGVGTALSWKAEIVAEEQNRFIGWRSMPGSTIRNAGKVEFKDAGELGTLIHATFSYHPPMGGAVEEAAKLLNPVFEKLVRNDVMGFKRYMETGTPQKLQQETVTIYT
jgi:uncharacterized membrane protein